MLSCQTGCCKACFILFFRVVCPFLIFSIEMIVWGELCLLRLLLDCDFDWFHSNWNEQKPTKRTFFFFFDCYNTWKKCGFLTDSGWSVCRNSLSAPYCLEIIQFWGPYTSWTNIYYFTSQYLTLFCIWHMEACNPPEISCFKTIAIWMYVMINISVTMRLLLKNTTLYVAFGTEEGAESLY